jgi:nucleolar protein 9
MRKIVDISSADDPAKDKSYQVPQSFKESLNQLLSQLTTNIDSTSARELAIDKLSSPVISCIISIQMQASHKKPKSQLMDLIFVNPKISMEKDSAEESFIEYLLSDPVGSHFLEGVISIMPMRCMERLYSLYMQSRVDKLVRRESGNFVIQAILRRLKPSEGKQVLDQLIGEIDILMSSNIPMVRAIVETATRLNYRIKDIADIFTKRYQVSHGNSSQFLEKILKLEGSTLGNNNDDWPTAEEMNRALLVQVLIRATPKFLSYASLGLVELPPKRLIELAKHSVFSHVLEACLAPETDITIRRRLLNSLTQPHVLADLACNAYGSHSVDRLWHCTYKLKFLRERVAEDLVKNAEQVKSSRYGMRVWNNWKLEKYVRKRYEWWILVKQEEDAIAEKLGESRDKKVERTQQGVKVKNDNALTTGKIKGRKHLENNTLHSKKPYDRPARKW